MIKKWAALLAVFYVVTWNEYTLRGRNCNWGCEYYDVEMTTHTIAFQTKRNAGLFTGYQEVNDFGVLEEAFEGIKPPQAFNVRTEETDPPLKPTSFSHPLPEDYLEPK